MEAYRSPENQVKGTVMAASSYRPFWWRFPSPSALLLLLIIGALPWIEVGCTGTEKDIENLNKPGPGGQKPPARLAEDGRFIFAIQNGYQTIWGGSSPGRDMAIIGRELEKEAKAKGTPTGGTPKTTKGPTAKEKNKDDEPGAAPLVAVYFVLILVAIGVGLAMPPGLWRSLAVGGTILLAAFLLLLQTLIGFPISTKLDKDMKKEGQVKLFGGSGSSWKPYTQLAVGYFLNWPFLLLPLGLLGIEELVAPRGKARTKRRRYDEEDEDDYDRPRRRSRREDEDEPPRRRRVVADEEDEPPPRRRVPANESLTNRPRRRPPPPDEEDEPEPPRRRRVVEDEEDDRPRRRRRPSGD
jgi:hypothetical protein